MGDALPIVDLGTGKIAAEIVTGYYFACARLTNGTVKCWGASTFGGALGYGDLMTRGDGPGEMGDNLSTVDLGTGKTAVQLSIGGGLHTCALLNDGTVKCWGFCFEGQCGIGETDTRGDSPGEMGDNLPTVDLGTGKTATAIAVSNHHSCAILNDGSVKCWGRGSLLGLGIPDNDYRGDVPGEMGDNLPTVNLGTGKTAVAIGASIWHTCVLLNDSTVKCWGFNDNGTLGYGHTNAIGDDPNEMGDNLPAVDLGTGKTVVSLSVGSGHNCALLNDGGLKCWGENDSGALGLGDTNHRGDAPNEMGDNLPYTLPF